MALPSLDQVIFPEQSNTNFSRILGDLKRSNLSITNRLRSIKQDAAFVQAVGQTLELPLVANERCGSWYIDPRLKTASAYFKSTDGHTGQWKFSTRRLNLHLLELIANHNGCVIIDSTRRGKRMPDALSKTVPVWCCVINRTLFPDNPSSHTLFVPPHVVSDTEKSQMEVRLPEFVDSLRALNFNLAFLRTHLTKPLRPLWVTQEDDVVADPVRQVAEDFYPVVCCTSSRRVAGTGVEIGEGGYIQGAGDDTENWALGLTAPVFWENADQLLSTPEADLPGLIQDVLAAAVPQCDALAVKQVLPHLSVGPLAASHCLPSDVCVITLGSKATDQNLWAKSPLQMEAGLGKSKAGSRALREALPHICEFASRYLTVAENAATSPVKSIAILCETGKDLSIGAALALSCWCFDSSGEIWTDSPQSFTKSGIRVRLGQIMTAMPDANPSRATLQSVNSFLIDWRK